MNLNNSNNISVVAYTPAGSGTGHLHRIHLVLEHLHKNGIYVILISGQQKFIPGLQDVPYDRVLLPRLKYSRIQERLERPSLTKLYEKVIIEVLRFVKPKYFLSTHHLGVSGELANIINTKSLWLNCKRILLWRDIPAHPVEFRAWVDTPQKRLYHTLSEDYEYIFVFGQIDIFNLEKIYNLPETIKKKLRYLGYVIPHSLPKGERKSIPKKAIVSFGGGENRENYTAILNTLILELINLKYQVKIYLGQYWSEKLNENLKSKYGSTVTILNYCDRTSYLSEVSNSEIVITSGGYNSVIESIFLGLRQIVIQENKRELTEMGFRNAKFKALGLIEIINNQMSRRSINHAILSVPKANQYKFNLNGSKELVKHIKNNA